MATVKIEHELLDSKVATAVALHNEWLGWCEDNGIPSYAIPHITAAFIVTEEDYINETR